MRGSSELWHWLDRQQLGVAFTTYQTNRLFLVGRKSDGRLAVNERLFDKPMGLFASSTSLYMACRYQIWQLENRLAPGEDHRGCDRLYVPSVCHTTGDLNVHDVALDTQGRLLFINTDFSCLAALRPGFSFEPIWRPPFISKLAAQDRCHLNGLALCDGEPAYASACSRTDTPAGWREQRGSGGVVMHIPSNEIVATGLSMPHSPRWYQGKLWLLNSGTGELGYVDGGRFHATTFLPGFVRGLAFHGDYALVGLSRLRSKTFAGLDLETRLAAQGKGSQCGLAVVDLRSGAVLHSLHIDGVVEELFDVVALPGVRRPNALGFQDDDIDRLVNFPGSDGLIVTKPTVQRPGLGKPVQKPGLPRAAQNAHAALEQQQDREHEDAAPIRFQQVFHLDPDNLLPYEGMSSPSLQARWARQAPRGELFGVSASVQGDMVGLAIAERFVGDDGQQTAELISLKLLPDYARQEIEAAMLRHLQQFAGLPLAR